MTVARRSLLIAAALVLGGCQVIAGLTGDYRADTTTTTGTGTGTSTGTGSSTGGAGGSGGSAACVSAAYPDPPGGTDAADVGRIVLALRTVEMGESGAVIPGYDLDHTCTCHAGAGATCVSAENQCDGPGGVDNSASNIFGLIHAALPPNEFGSVAYTAQAEAGKWSLLFRIDGYNGLPDDPAVDVAIYPSPGRASAPSWGGKDTWPVDEKSVGPGGVSEPIYVSQGAYVAHGVLVAAMPAAKIVLSGTTSFGVALKGGVVTGRLAQSEGAWRLTEGVLAARWALADLFAVIGSLRFSGKPVCTDTPFVYDQLKGTLCNGADILVDASGSKSLPCDAISLGIGFTAEPALLGPIQPSAEPPPGCPPETDPAGDSCP